MIIYGINALNHDASLCVVNSDSKDILFAAHAERYSRIKNDKYLNQTIINDALQYGEPDLIIWYENPILKNIRYLYSKDFNSLFNYESPQKYLKSLGLFAPVRFSNHHLSHAAGAFYTSGLNDATVLVIDAIGELLTASIWRASNNEIKKIWSLKYPNSLGLFYSAITQLVGLKPNEEEYILMGMSAFGNDPTGSLADYLKSNYFKNRNPLKQSYNFHHGLLHDAFLSRNINSGQFKFDLAYAAQSIIKETVQYLVTLAYNKSASKYLVYSGGVALNCVANSKIHSSFEKIWIMPNPGDAGSSLGAIANYLRKPLKWESPFLGYNIDRKLNVDGIINELMTVGICGIANGKAEFGPRALGNRSLLADPRRADIKDKVNSIKKRQKFRPFAPAVLKEFASEYFDVSDTSKDYRYMQYAVRNKKPDFLPAVSHIDNTSRVQVVDNTAANLNVILKEWYKRTGCPVLLNTSLNIKGEPLINTFADALTWQQKYNVKVF